VVLSVHGGGNPFQCYRRLSLDQMDLYETSVSYTSVILCVLLSAFEARLMAGLTLDTGGGGGGMLMLDLVRPRALSRSKAPKSLSASSVLLVFARLEAALPPARGASKVHQQLRPISRMTYLH
jgi:hypothetical protein